MYICRYALEKIKLVEEINNIYFFKRFYSIAPRIPPGRDKGNRKSEIGNGKWEMGSGKWEMGNGKRETGNGKWEIGSGKLEVGNGRSEMGEEIGDGTSIEQNL